MKPIIRTLAIAAVLACAAGTAAEAQSAAREPSRSGVHLGLYLNQSTLPLSFAEATEWKLSPGFGIHAGYEYAPGASVFARAGVTSSGGEYGVSHADVGLRLSLNDSESALRPFIQGSVGTRGIPLEGSSSRARGFALTAGGGVEYFVSRTVAIEGGLSLSAGSINHSRVTPVVSGRFDVGVSWHP
ncbi:MAG TPA: outer membrane beta-barrel protein [Longimicrobium sp.]|nr:outer membrane beta-barrel protein [Longimicrobium sp.]